MTSHGPRDLARHQGVAALADRELLALVLGHGLRGTPVLALADRILDEVGGLAGLSRAGPGAMEAIEGVGEATALRVLGAMELGRRSIQRAAAPRPRLGSPAEVAAHFAPRVAGLLVEQMWLVALDGQNRLRGERVVARGGHHALSITAREILAAALAEGASGFLLVHNHPSGCATPSGADVAMTERVARAAQVVGVPLLDHLVVTASGAYCSLLEEGYLSLRDDGV